MKILYVLSGAEIGTFYRALFWAKFLSKRGHRVTIICAHPQSSYKIFKIKFIENVKIINLFRTRQRWDFIGFIIRGIIVLFLCIFNKADVIHAFVVWQPPSMMAIFAARFLQILRIKKCIVLADWDDWWGEGGISEEHGNLLRCSISILERKIPKFANIVTVVSKGLMRRAVCVGIDKDRIRVVSNGCDVERIKVLDSVVSRSHLKLAINNRYILTYIGNSHLPQFFYMMFSAIQKVSEQKIDAILLLIGDIPEVYKKSISNVIKEKVLFLGKQPQENIPFILGASDILLLPMVANVEEESRWPIRFGDYLASGRPIVSNAVGEIKAIMEANKCGIISNYDDPEDFSRQILNLLSHENTCREIGIRARKTAEMVYSWNIVVEKLEDIYIDTHNKILRSLAAEYFTAKQHCKACITKGI